MARSRKITIAETVLERSGRILTERWDIKVVFHANKCETTGKVIYLPVIPEGADDELLKAFPGYLDHEAAHCVHTDFSLLKQMDGKPKWLTIMNAMEDRRIEVLWCKTYPGARYNLDSTHEWLCQQTAMPAEIEEMDPITKVVTKRQGRRWDRLSDLGKLIYAAGVYTMVGNADHWFLREVVEPDILKVVETKAADLFARAVDAPTTGDVINLAKELMDRLAEVDEPAPPMQEIDPSQIPPDAQVISAADMPSPQEQVMMKQPPRDPNAPPTIVVSPPSDPDPADAGNEPGDPQQSPPAPGTPTEAGEDDAADSAPDAEPSEPQPARNFNPDDKELQEDEAVTNLSKNLRQSVKQVVTDRDAYLVFTTEGDKTEVIKPGNSAEFTQFTRETAGIVSPIRRTMVRVLSSRKESRWEGGKLRGKIDHRRLYRLVSGTSHEVFRELVPGEALDVAALLAVDHSGSMKGEKLTLASRLCGVLGQTFEPLKIPLAIYGWSTGDSHIASERQYRATSEEASMYTRWGNLWLGEYKRFEEPWRKAGPKVLTMPNHVKHNTYDGESIKVMARKLLARPEKRKILFIFNDGEPCPNGPDDTQAHYNYAKECAKAVEGMVETVAFGVMTSAVKDIYANTVIINDLSELPKLVLSELSDRLLKGKLGFKPKHSASVAV